MIPQDRETWKNCIEKTCGILLTKQFVLERLAVYQDASNPETRTFEELYGKQHLKNIIQWFQQEV